MVVYCEIILISNFFIDIFIFSLVLTILKCPINIKRLIVGGIIGGICSSILPLMWKYENLCKIIMIVCFPLIIRNNKNIKEYANTLTVFLTTTLLIGGFVYLLKNSITGLDKIYVGYGVIPILFSISGILSIYLIHFLKSNIEKERNKNKNIYKVKISDGIKYIIKDAYFDSGNRVYANNGDPISIVSKSIYNNLVGEEKEIIVQTIGGYVSLTYKMVEIKIYSDFNENIIYKTGIAAAPFLSSQYEVILHCDMLGEVK